MQAIEKHDSMKSSGIGRLSPRDRSGRQGLIFSFGERRRPYQRTSVGHQPSRSTVKNGGRSSSTIWHVEAYFREGSQGFPRPQGTDFPFALSRGWRQEFESSCEKKLTLPDSIAYLTEDVSKRSAQSPASVHWLWWATLDVRSRPACDGYLPSSIGSPSLAFRMGPNFWPPGSLAAFPPFRWLRKPQP